MHRPAFAARGSSRHLFASPVVAVLAGLGFVILGLGILIGPAGAVLGVVVLGMLAWQWRRLRRLRIEVDAPGDGARLRLGRDGSESVLLADVAGGIAHRTAGTTYRGFRTGADIERWLIMGHDGRVLARVDGRGFAGKDLAAARDRIGGTWMTSARALAVGAMPAEAPWDMRRPGAAAALALLAGLVTAVVLVTGFVQLTRLGTAAFVWPWW